MGIDWAEYDRYWAEYQRTIPNVADVARGIPRNRPGADAGIVDQLKDIQRQIDAITMMVLEISTYLVGHEKSMGPAEFAAWVGMSPKTIARRVNDGRIRSAGGRIPPATLREYGIGPTSPWPKQSG